jgi:hypothetical protein
LHRRLRLPDAQANVGGIEPRDDLPALHPTAQVDGDGAPVAGSSLRQATTRPITTTKNNAKAILGIAAIPPSGLNLDPMPTSQAPVSRGAVARRACLTA